MSLNIVYSLVENSEILSMVRDHIIGNMEWPSKSDVAGAVFSLVTIQYTYKIPVVDFVKGKIGKRNTKATLTIDDIEHIVQGRMQDNKSHSHILFGNNYAIAIEWLEAGIR